MQKVKDNPQKEKTYPDELQEVFEKAHRGDKSVLPQLRQAFDEHPELAAHFGDLVQHAEASLLALAAGDSLLGREAISRQVADLRRRLSATAASELEKLLIDPVCVCWIEVYYADADLARQLLACPGQSPAAQAADKRLGRAHTRYLAAVKALATVQRLARPAPSPVDLLRRPVAETAAGAASSPEARSRFTMAGVDG